MGRARGETGDFEAVLGARRGAPAAQAQRDAAEVEAREAAVVAFAAAVAQISESREVIDAVVEAYRAGVTPDTPEYAQLLEALAVRANRWGGSGMIAVAALGDPEGWPELTTPVVAALGSFFAEPPPAPLIPHPSVYEQAGHAIGGCLAGADLDVSYCRRLQPLIEGLAVLLTRAPKFAEATFRVRAAEVLRVASSPVLIGPLARWIAAFAQRTREDRLGDAEELIGAQERSLLLALIDESRDPERTLALSALARALSDEPSA